MLRIFKWVSVIAILLSLLYFISATDMQQVSNSLRAVGFNFFYLLLITLSAYVSATIGWRYCIQTNVQKPSIFNLFLIRHIGEMVSLVNPASVIGGEAVKVHLLQNTGLGVTTGLTSILLSRMMMAVTQLLLLIIVTVDVVAGNWKSFSNWPSFQLSDVSFTTQAILLAAVVILFFLFKNLVRTLKVRLLFQRIERKLRLGEVWVEFRQFFKTNKTGLCLCALFFQLHWIIGSFEVYFILRFLGIHATIADVILVDMGVIIFKSAGVFVPGQIGVEEFGNKFMLDLIGIPDDGVWLTVSVLRRSRQLFWICFGGAAYLLFYRQLNRVPEYPHGNTLHQP